MAGAPGTPGAGLTRVPRVVTVRPGQHRLEAVGQVEESPGQDDDVVHAAVQDHHLAGIAESCRGGGGGRKVDPISWPTRSRKLTALQSVHSAIRPKVPRGPDERNPFIQTLDSPPTSSISPRRVTCGLVRGLGRGGESAGRHK